MRPEVLEVESLEVVFDDVVLFVKRLANCVAADPEIFWLKAALAVIDARTVVIKVVGPMTRLLDAGDEAMAIWILLTLLLA